MAAHVPDQKSNEALEAVSLWGACGEFSMPGSLWLALQTVAQIYGWMPAGTDAADANVIEFDRGLQGSYFPPNGQIVTREDAQRFAQALGRAFLDIPEGTAPPEDGLFAGWNERSASVMQRFGTVKSIIRDLIVHCRDCSELWIC
jgi:hypothetical protein